MINEYEVEVTLNNGKRILLSVTDNNTYDATVAAHQWMVDHAVNSYDTIAAMFKETRPDNQVKRVRFKGELV